MLRKWIVDVKLDMIASAEDNSGEGSKELLSDILMAIKARLNSQDSYRSGRETLLCPFGTYLGETNMNQYFVDEE